MGIWQILLLVGALLCCGARNATPLPLHDEEHEPETFRDIVRRLVRASRENLRPLKTFRVEMHPSRDYWYEVEVTLPGAKLCRIYEHPRMVYRCEWKKPSNVAANTVYAAAVKSIQEALGQAEWTAHAFSSGAPATRFEPVNPRRNPVWEVRIRGTKNNPVVEVLLFSVDRWGESMD